MTPVRSPLVTIFYGPIFTEARGSPLNPTLNIYFLQEIVFKALQSSRQNLASIPFVFCKT